MSASKLAKIITDFLVPYVYSGGIKNIYYGNIPINLDAPFNMGEAASEICHPELDDTWMILLSRLTFAVTWSDNVPNVDMIHNHETYYFSYTAECPSSIKLEIHQCAIETPVHARLRLLMFDVFKNIMLEIIKPLLPKNIEENFVCSAVWNTPPTEPRSIANNNKRKLSGFEI